MSSVSVEALQEGELKFPVENQHCLNPSFLIGLENLHEKFILSYCSLNNKYLAVIHKERII